MDWDRRCIRFCAGLLLCAVLLRLWAGGTLLPAAQALQSSRAAAFFLYLQTGRVVRSIPQPTAQPVRSPEPVREQVTFTGADLALLNLDDSCGQSPDLEQLLLAPLDLDLTGAEPRVLILHTHTTESYTQAGPDRYEESSPYRTLDPGHNMLVLGELVAQRLRSAGIGVVHDAQFHDYPSYNGSYSHAAASTKEYLNQYPTIQLVLDLHRDAADTPSGQLVTRCALEGETAAQLMFVLGTDTRLSHPDWEENLSLALKLQVLLERRAPGICRDLSLSKNRYNQHLGPYALLVEIGAAGNTLDQAKLAAEQLAEAIIQLASS